VTSALSNPSSYPPETSIVVENVTKTFSLRYHRTFKEFYVDHVLADTVDEP